MIEVTEEFKSELFSCLKNLEELVDKKLVTRDDFLRILTALRALILIVTKCDIYDLL